jgi:hypothetical protein
LVGFLLLHVLHNAHILVLSLSATISAPHHGVLGRQNKSGARRTRSDILREKQLTILIIRCQAKDKIAALKQALEKRHVQNVDLDSPCLQAAVGKRPESKLL